METNDEILNIIISLLKGCKNNGALESYNNKLNCKYLLGQVLRQLQTKPGHLYISKKAKQLWEEMTDRNICDFWYNKLVVINKPDFHKGLRRYIGNTKIPKNLELFEYGKSFKYREIFHDEHIIPISDIEVKLLKLAEPTYENVQTLIDNINLCKMLKEEDKAIKEKYNRNFDVDTVIKTTYAEANIEIELLK